MFLETIVKEHKCTERGRGEAFAPRSIWIKKIWANFYRTLLKFGQFLMKSVISRVILTIRSPQIRSQVTSNSVVILWSLVKTMNLFMYEALALSFDKAKLQVLEKLRSERIAHYLFISVHERSCWCLFDSSERLKIYITDLWKYMTLIPKRSKLESNIMPYAIFVTCLRPSFYFKMVCYLSTT